MVPGPLPCLLDAQAQVPPSLEALLHFPGLVPDPASARRAPIRAVAAHVTAPLPCDLALGAERPSAPSYAGVRWWEPPQPGRRGAGSQRPARCLGLGLLFTPVLSRSLPLPLSLTLSSLVFCLIYAHTPSFSPSVSLFRCQAAQKKTRFPCVILLTLNCPWEGPARRSLLPPRSVAWGEAGPACLVPHCRAAPRRSGMGTLFIIVDIKYPRLSEESSHGSSTLSLFLVSWSRFIGQTCPDRKGFSDSHL